MNTRGWFVGLSDFLKFSRFSVLLHIVPREAPAIHCHIDTRRQSLDKCKRTAEIKQSIGAAELIWNHGSGKNHGLVVDDGTECLRRALHGVGTVRDDDFVFFGFLAMFQDTAAVVLRHLKTIDQHQRPNIDVDSGPPEFEHFGKMRVFEEEFAVDFVVFFVKRAAGYEDSDCHGVGEVKSCQVLLD
jgi:hypothetical protein